MPPRPTTRRLQGVAIVARNLVRRESQRSERFDIILFHGCYFIADMVATSSPPRLRARVLERVFSSLLHLPSCLLSLLIVARTQFPSLSLPLSLSVSLSLSTTIYECLVFLGLHDYQCVQLRIYDSSEDFQLYI